MGLDMYAYVTDKEPTSQVDFCKPETETRLHYWRKHPDLHEWMEALYVAKGGSDPEFNLAPVLLTAADLDELEAAIMGKELPDDLDFVSKAREAIGHGKFVYYVAWW